MKTFIIDELITITINLKYNDSDFIDLTLLDAKMDNYNLLL